MGVDTSYLTTQVNTIVTQLHGLFDEIGVPNHERESRESELFSALSETLHDHLRRVDSEKNELLDDAHQLMTTIQQMESSLDDPGRTRQRDSEDMRLTYPLNRCLNNLKEKHNAVSKLHRERYEQVKKLVQALQSYSSHLESSFVSIPLPPTSPGSTVSPSFDLSPAYVSALDNEFTRVYEEYTRRVSTVTCIGEEIIKLWAELGTPQAQTDSSIVQNYKDSPEQLGLHESDLSSLRSRREKLLEEKRSRERKVHELKAAVENLWSRLGVEERDRKGFLAANRGCGLRTINEFEDELARLNELKRQNLHLFVEDARCRLQELWDGLYYSEEEMLDFTPAFSDVYSDALLSAHEAEIARLEALMDQRAPALQLIERHRTLVQDRDALAASSQDASRLVARGNKGERRDPTRLLREEKMRKRIAKELPKIEVDLKRFLERWEDEYGRPFLVHGERYLDEIAVLAAKAPPRSKTPCGPPRSKTPCGPPQNPRPASANAPAPGRWGSVRGGAPPSSAKTPTTNGTLKRNQLAQSVSGHTSKSPSKIPSRVPLGNLPHGNNSPERQMPPAQNYSSSAIRGKMGPPRAPPPKMRDIFTAPRSETSQGMYQVGRDNGTVMSNMSTMNVRPISPEDVYDDRHQHSYASSSHSQNRPNFSSSVQSYHHSSNSQDSGYYRQQQHQHQQHQQQQQQQAPFMAHANEQFYRPPAPPSNRQISNSSTVNTGASGSENWETFDDDASESEADATEVYYAKLRAAHGKRLGGDSHPGGTKKAKAIRGVGMEESMIEDSGMMRRVEGSDAGWTDDLESY